MEERVTDQATETLLGTLEKHAYCKITELIDANRYAEAGQIVTILQGVGLI